MKKNNGIVLSKRRTDRDIEIINSGTNSEQPDHTQLLAVLTALRKGDFTVRLPVDWVGVQGKIGDGINEVIEKNQKMAMELERMSRVVGKEGKISQRASIGEVSGSWAASIASVNTLISDLVHPTSETSRVIGAV